MNRTMVSERHRHSSPRLGLAARRPSFQPLLPLDILTQANQRSAAGTAGFTQANAQPDPPQRTQNTQLGSFSQGFVWSSSRPRPSTAGPDSG